MDHKAFGESLAFGKVGESYIATWLRRVRGYHILPVYDVELHTGKGPVFFPESGEQWVAPDILAFKRAAQRATFDSSGNPVNVVDIRWVEAKTKSSFSWHRISSQWVTGIDLHHYEQYLKVDEVSPWDVWLLFLHLDGRAKDSPEGSPVGLFGGRLANLRLKESHRSDKWGKSGMVYWALSALRKVATLDEVLAAAAPAEVDA